MRRANRVGRKWRVGAGMRRFREGGDSMAGISKVADAEHHAALDRVKVDEEERGIGAAVAEEGGAGGGVRENSQMNL